MGFATEEIKMSTNGPKCNELGWECIRLAVKAYLYGGFSSNFRAQFRLGDNWLQYKISFQ